MYLRQFLVGDPGRGVGGGKRTPQKWFRLLCLPFDRSYDSSLESVSSDSLQYFTPINAATGGASRK